MDELVSDAEWQAIELAMAAVPVRSVPFRTLPPSAVALPRLEGGSLPQPNVSPRPPSAPCGNGPASSSASPAAYSPLTAASRAVSDPPRPGAPLNHQVLKAQQAPIVLSMWDRHRFMITNYPVQLFDWLRRFPGAVFQEQPVKVFHFPFKDYAMFVKTVRSFKYEKVSEVPAHVVDALCNPRPPEAPFSIDRIPNALWDGLFPFQREGVEFAVNHNGRCLIADEMGLGKTIQAITVARYYREDWPLLIVCPSSLRSAWEQQIDQWLPNEAAGINLVASSKGSIDYPINIVSIALVEKMQKTLSEKRFSMIIVDECHYLKNGKAKRTQALIPLLQKAKRCILLSGTPALSRPSELFSQLNALNPLLYANFRTFANRYCDPKTMPFGTVYNGAKNTRELNALLSLLMIRRKKDDVLDQLPAKTRQKVLLHVDAKVLDQLNKQRNDQLVVKDALMFSEDRGVALEANFLKHSLFFEQFRNTGRAKLPAVCDYLLEALGDEELGPKFLVFAHHIDVLDGICHALTQEKKRFIRIDGKTPAAQRQPLVDVFQNTPGMRVAVLSITAAGVGLTLTAASNVFFAELFYNPGALLQAEDRAHRIGQLNSVNVHYLVARNTVDEALFRMLNSKISVLGETLDGISGKKLEISSGQDREVAGSELFKNFSEDAFLSEVVNMVKGESGSSQERTTKRVRFLNDDEEENQPVVDADEVLKAVREQPKEAVASKFGAFMFGAAKK